MPSCAKAISDRLLPHIAPLKKSLPLHGVSMDRDGFYFYLAIGTSLAVLVILVLILAHELP
jgi:hypothetical protein